MTMNYSIRSGTTLTLYGRVLYGTHIVLGNVEKYDGVIQNRIDV